MKDFRFIGIDGLALEEAALSKNSGIAKERAFQGVNLSGITPKLQDTGSGKGFQLINVSHTAVSIRLEADRKSVV